MAQSNRGEHFVLWGEGGGGRGNTKVEKGGLSHFEGDKHHEGQNQTEGVTNEPDPEVPSKAKVFRRAFGMIVIIKPTEVA